MSYDVVANEGTVSNPNLKPQRAENWDVALEYYFDRVGQFSIGVFRKELKDFIARTQIETPEWLVGDDIPADAVFTTTINGESARIDGIELSYHQTLSFLPGLLRGLTVYANYTRLRTNGNYGGVNSTNELPRFVPDSANLGFSWKYGRIILSAKLNHTGDQLWEHAAQKYDLIYKDARTQVNFGVSCKLRPNMTLSLDFIDAFDAPQRFYFFTRERPHRYIVAGTTVIFGLKGSF
jgi:TonB-dependent receptor